MYYLTRARCKGYLKHKNAVRRLHNGNPVVIGIRREDPLRIWERRCPLTPEAVHSLIQDEGARVLVQPCERRVFTMDQFKEVRVTVP